MSRRIQQLQSFTTITDTDSGSLVSRTRIHHLILCHKIKNPLLQSDRNTDLTFQVRRSTVLQGILHKGVTPTAVGGVAAIILAPFTLIAGDMWQPLLFIAGFVVMMIVPGHILNYKSNHPAR